MTNDGDPDQIESHLRDCFLRALAGEASAYEEFLRTLAKHLRAYFKRRLTGSPDVAEDLVQDTLLAIHNKRHTYHSHRPLSAWAYAIAKYKLIDYLRRQARTGGRTQSLELSGEGADALLAAADAESAANQSDLMRLLDELPAKQKSAILRTKLQGLSVAEAAARTGMSEAAVKVNVHRGIKALAARLRGEG